MITSPWILAYSSFAHICAFFYFSCVSYSAAAAATAAASTTHYISSLLLSQATQHQILAFVHFASLAFFFPLHKPSCESSVCVARTTKPHDGCGVAFTERDRLRLGRRVFCSLVVHKGAFFLLCFGLRCVLTLFARVPWRNVQTGLIVRWVIFLSLLGIVLLYVVVGHLHARRRIKKGLQPLAYHRVSRNHASSMKRDFVSWPMWQRYPVAATNKRVLSNSAS